MNCIKDNFDILLKKSLSVIYVNILTISLFCLVYQQCKMQLHRKASLCCSSAIKIFWTLGECHLCSFYITNATTCSLCRADAGSDNCTHLWHLCILRAYHSILYFKLEGKYVIISSIECTVTVWIKYPFDCFITEKSVCVPRPSSAPAQPGHGNN